MKSLKWLICSLVTLLLMAIPAAANGVPVKIFLNYLPEFSNYGSTQATGVALISFGEAWVDVQAEGLPQVSGYLYEAWLVRTETNELISLGKFNTDTNGRVSYHVEFNQLPEVDYRYFAISVEPDPDPSPQADIHWTIAGVFPNAELLVPTSTPPSTPPSGQPGVTPTPGAPAALPVTGDLVVQNSASFFGFLGLGGAALGFIFIVIGLFYWRNHHQAAGSKTI